MYIDVHCGYMVSSFVNKTSAGSGHLDVLVVETGWKLAPAHVFFSSIINSHFQGSFNSEDADNIVKEVTLPFVSSPS